MFSTETVNKFETPSIKENTVPKCNSVQNQRHLQLFCKDLSKINIPDECGWTPLYRTVVAGDIFSSTLLLNNGADPNIQCTMGETPLYQAVDMEKIDHIKLLLKNGANPNITNDDGLSPLHAAVYKQNINIVKILLKYGANPNLKSKLYQQTPLHIAIKNNTDPMILLLLVQFNGSLMDEDKFKKKPIDYTNSKEMQSTIEKLKFGQEKIKNDIPVHSFQTPKKRYDWTPSNVYSNTIRTQSHPKNIIIEGSNAVLQNPGNLKYTIINAKNSVSSISGSNNNTGNTKVVEAVKKDLFSSSEKTKTKTKMEKNYNCNNNYENDNKEIIDMNSINSDKYIIDVKQKNKIINLLEDKENICPNNNISFSIRNAKTGKFCSNREENSLYESRQNNNSIKTVRSLKQTNESKLSDNDKNENHNFSFSTNTFNNNYSKKKTNLSQSIKNEENDENKNNSNYNEEYNNNKKKNNKNKIKKDNINININSTNKKKIIIKSYYNKEKENYNNYSNTKKQKNSDKNYNNNKNNDGDYLYEKIIKKSITKIEIYDDENTTVNEIINKTTKKDLNEEDSITKSPNTSLYNKPKIKSKSKFNFKKSSKIINMRPSIKLQLNKSNNSVDNNTTLLPIRSTFSKKMKNDLNKNLSFHIKKVPTSGQINTDNNKKIKIKNNKTNSFSRTSVTTQSRNETSQNQNQNSLWKFYNEIITNEKTICNSLLTNNINSDIDNEFETNYKYPIYEWLKEINLHCYYSLFKEKRIFCMDKVITNLKTGKYNITKNDIQKMGILIPGHIYRIITKLEIDSGKIKENINNYLIKKKKRMSGKEINMTRNSITYCCGCCAASEHMHNYNKYKKMFNLDAWLNKIKMIKYKDNFIENGFDFFEYFILQMFSTIPVDDYIIKEELKIENDKDRDIILLRLNKDVKYIMQKTDGILGYNNSYEFGEQRNFDDNNNVYEFNTSQDEKINENECIII